MGFVARHRARDLVPPPLRHLPRRLRRDTRGVVALEFAIVFPASLMFFMSVLGVGLGGFYQLALDDAVRSAARQLQIAGPASTSSAAFVTEVCREFGLLAGNCTTTLSYNLQVSVPPATFGSLSPVALLPSGVLSNGFPTFPPGSNVLVQVAYPLPFLLPYIGSAITFTGTNSIFSTTTVRMEPFG